MENERLFDIRTLERNLEKGLVTSKDIQGHLKSLDDSESNAVEIAAQYKLTGDEEE